jgi:hypothetical protein
MKTLALSLATLLAFALGTPEAAAADYGRLGTYESRAVALAWARSTQRNESLRALLAQAREADASGDKLKLQAAKKEVSAQYELLSKQISGDERIPNVMQQLEARMPIILVKAGVSRIIDQRDAPKETETIDVTLIVVAEFNPTEKTLRQIAEIRKRPLRRAR